MSCSRCADEFHNARKCSLPADAPEEVKDRARKEASIRWRAAYAAAQARWGHPVTRPQIVEELRRLYQPTQVERSAPARQRRPTAPDDASDAVEITPPRRTVVIVRGGDGAKGFSDAFSAASRGDTDKWHVVAAAGLAAGVRTALALQADHVVLCVSLKLDKLTLKPWVQRLRSIHGLQVIAVYDSYAKLDEVEEEVDSIGFDEWASTDRVKDRLESIIAEWKPSEHWIKSPAPWMPLLRAVN